MCKASLRVCISLAAKVLRVYLAHSVYRREEGREIQTRLESLGLEVYNPFYPPDLELFRGDIESLDKGKIMPWNIEDKERSAWIVETDLKALRKSDFLVAIIPDIRTIGIPCEMMYAWINKIPIYSICPEDMKGHPWIVSLSKLVVMNIEELIETLRYEYLKSVGTKGTQEGN